MLINNDLLFIILEDGSDVWDDGGYRQAPEVGAQAREGWYEALAGAEPTSIILGPEYGHKHGHKCPLLLLGVF